MEKWSSLHLPQGRSFNILDCAVQIDVLQSTWCREGRALPCADRCPPVNVAQGRAGMALCRWMSSAQHGTGKGGHCSVQIDVLRSTWHREEQALLSGDGPHSSYKSLNLFSIWSWCCWATEHGLLWPARLRVGGPNAGA